MESYVRAGVAWLLASLATALAFSKLEEGSPREVGEFLVIFIFDLALTALVGVIAVYCSRWFLAVDEEVDPDAARVHSFSMSMVTLGVASLTYWLFVIK
ncbi:MAG: hypothetical protein M1389_11205 [Chloroflexi bacterium]|nr:hypothetical protein [Chloroflexota bacterium]